VNIDIGALIDAKYPLQACRSNPWDLFVSAYNDSERVQRVFTAVPAKNRAWWVLPEYAYTSGEISHLQNAVHLDGGHEDEVVTQGMRQIGFDPTQRLCFDITGMMRPQILFLMAYLSEQGCRSFDLLYTEPEHYKRRAETQFSIGEDVEVRSVSGYIGAHENDVNGDVLVLGVGYDHQLISHALQAKETARILQLHSFPSLSADMYHESILRLHRVRSERSRIGDEVYFSSANDPFVIASSLATAVDAVAKHREITNLYLTPLATKPQAVGFGLYYLRHLRTGPASMIYPNALFYDRETSKGVGRSWVYPITL
jgi:hypothetical protein